ncbi:MAG TPA: gamma-glutamylcyclotransferase family protein [Thermoanaerobaculia bacterium]|nr:gamma-glutamylcyclotransferase family protein [Thermoanaerobaculia bacterium]
MKPDTSTQLFVYGTLRNDPSHEMFHLLARNAKFVGEARVAGRLYDLGEYPGMTVQADGGKYVKGELYDVRPERWADVIQQLDRYEGCADGDPEPREYRRELVRAQLSNGRPVDAWAYVLNCPSRGLSEITSGDYLAKLVAS